MTPCTNCGSRTVGTIVTDALTGTAYERCECGVHRRLSPGGWMDWHGGLWLDDGSTTGSSWSGKPSPKLLPEASKWTKTSKRS